MDACREAPTAVGGVPDDTLAEATDLSTAVRRACWPVVHEPDAVVWTKAPWRTGQLWRQRYRWAFGIDRGNTGERWSSPGRAGGSGDAASCTCWNSGWGTRCCLPWPKSAHAGLPAILPPRPGITFLLAYFGGRVATTAYALRRGQEGLRGLWALPLHLLCFRPLLYLVSIQAMAAAAEDVLLLWHQARRKGAAATTTPHPSPRPARLLVPRKYPVEHRPPTPAKPRVPPRSFLIARP